MEQEGRKGGRTRGFGDGTEEAIRALIEVHRHLGSRLTTANPSALPCFLCNPNEGMPQDQALTEEWTPGRSPGSPGDDTEVSRIAEDADIKSRRTICGTRGSRGRARG